MLVLLDRSEWIEKLIGARTFLPAHFVQRARKPTLLLGNHTCHYLYNRPIEASVTARAIFDR